MNQISLKKQYPENLAGRDFVIGDLHGSYQSLMERLQEVQFNPQTDRLFCTGDLCDRGPDSLRTLELLRQDYFYCAMGNHDFFILDFLKFTEEEKEQNKENYSENGAGWLYRLSPSELEDVKALAEVMVNKCPMICEVTTLSGDVSFRIAHASLPDFYVGIEGEYEVYEEDISLLCWERSKADYAKKQAESSSDKLTVDHTEWSVLDGASHRPLTFIGHTIFNVPTYKDGFAYIDTGAFKAEKQSPWAVSTAKGNQLTLANVSNLKAALENHFQCAKPGLQP